MQHILVTGGAGFIGSHLVDRLLAEGRFSVTALDDFNDFYAPERKRENVRAHLASDAYRLVEADIRDRAALEPIFREKQFDCIVRRESFAPPTRRILISRTSLTIWSIRTACCTTRRIRSAPSAKCIACSNQGGAPSSCSTTATLLTIASI